MHPVGKSDLGRAVVVIVVAIVRLELQVGRDLGGDHVVRQQRVDIAVEALRRQRGGRIHRNPGGAAPAGRDAAGSGERRNGERQERIVLAHVGVGDRCHVAASPRQIGAHGRRHAVGLVARPHRHQRDGHRGGRAGKRASLVDGAGRAERIFHRVGAGVVRIGRAAIGDLDVEFLVPERVAEIFGAGAVVLRGIGDRPRRVDPHGRDVGAEEDAVDLGAGAAHVRIVGPQVPVVVGRIAIVHRGGIAANAEIGLVRVVHDIPLDQGGVGGRDADCRSRQDPEDSRRP